MKILINMRYKHYILLWLICFIVPRFLHAQSFNKSTVRSFKANSSTAVNITNKYGKVHVNTWNKDSVLIEINFYGEATSDAKLEDIKESINFDISSSGNAITAQTVFQKSGGIITEFVDAFVPSSQVVIDYTLYIPMDVNLNINNKFGNVYVDDFKGDVNINIANGDLKANELEGSTTLRLSSGDADIDKVSNGEFFLSYSNLDIDEVIGLQLETRSSRINIEEANYLRLKSRRDKYKLGMIKELMGTGNLSTISIEEFNDEFNVEMKYGGVELESIEPEFTFVNISSEYTDIDINFQRECNYILDITHHQDAMLKIPSKIKVKTENLNPSEKLLLTFGQYGNVAASTIPKVKISALKKCMINILQQ